MRRSLLPFLLALAACGRADPGLRPQAPTRPALPADVDWAETTVPGAGGVALYVQRWRPAGTPRGVVLVHHGLADHSSRYAGFATRLVAAGYAVWAYDLRGHARSAGPRLTFDRIDELLGDLDAVLRRVRADEPGRPVFLYGHSLGGLVTTLYTIERQPDLAGLIVAAPGIAFEAPVLQPGAIRVLAVLGPGLPAATTPHAAFSRRPEVVAEMDHDPLIDQGKLPVRSARSAIDGVARIWAAPERLRAPLLALHGTADRLTAPSGSRDLVARAGGADRTLRLYDGLYHDLLREPDGAGERVIAEVVAWLDAHTGGAPVTFEAPAPRHLRGDVRGRVAALELDARAAASDADARSASGGLRLRLGRGRPLGYLGGLDLRAGVADGSFAYAADLHGLGLGLRGRGGALLALTGGVGIADGDWRAPLELALELPAGPTRLVARGGLALGETDVASAQLGLRLGRDRRYWADVIGGAGPQLALTYQRAGGADVLGVALALSLWGGD